jgi:hypothetical protein
MKPRFVLRNDILYLTNVPIHSLKKTDRTLKWQSRFGWILELVYNRALRMTGIFNKQKEYLTKAILRDFIQTACTCGGTPILVYLDEVRSGNWDEALTDREQRINEFCQQQNIHCIFIRQYIAKNYKNRINFEPSWHFKPEVHHLIARVIHSYLIENNLIIH